MNRLRTSVTGLVCFVIGFLLGFVVNDSLHIPLMSHLIKIISTLNAEWITAFTGSLAFIVATLTLWYSTLKSADIKICEKPEFTLEKISKDSFNYYIPDTFRFAPTRLVFLNHGPRAGAFMPEIKFNCSEKLRPFFKRHSCYLKLDDKNLEKSMYLGIREKECLIIEVSLMVEFHDWKEYFDSGPVEPERIRDVLCQTDQRNKQRFSNFCSILEPKMFIGKIDIRTRQTTRSKIFWTGMEEKSHFMGLGGGLVDEELIGNFQSCLIRWDDIKPNPILERIPDVEKDLEKELLTPLYDNYRRLKDYEQLDSLRPVPLDSWMRSCEGHGVKKDVANFLIRSMNLDSSFSKYNAEVNKFNKAMELYRQISPGKPAVGDDKRMDPLIDMSSDLIKKVEELRGVLRSCLMSNV